jgi:hypothetical protein
MLFEFFTFDKRRLMPVTAAAHPVRIPTPKVAISDALPAIPKHTVAREPSMPPAIEPQRALSRQTGERLDSLANPAVEPKGAPRHWRVAGR